MPFFHDMRRFLYEYVNVNSNTNEESKITKNRYFSYFFRIMHRQTRDKYSVFIFDLCGYRMTIKHAHWINPWKKTTIIQK